MLRRWLAVVAVLVAAIAITVVPVGSAVACRPSDPGCVVITDGTTTTVQPTDPGGGGGGGEPTTCLDRWELLTGAEAELFLAWGNKDPELYDAYRSQCPKDERGPDGMWFNYTFVLKSQGLPPPDPQVIATVVAARLYLPEPQAQFSPNPDQVAVDVPVALAVSDPGTLSDSDSDRGLTVTVTARVTSLVWSMGEPGREQVRCDGVGSTATDPTAAACAFVYTLRSLPERTGGAGQWTVTVTATWSIHWVASSGQSGDMTRTRTASTTLYVGEYRTVMVPGG